jgi:hypothetical protein
MLGIILKEGMIYLTIFPLSYHSRRGDMDILPSKVVIHNITLCLSPPIYTKNDGTLIQFLGGQ